MKQSLAFFLWRSSTLAIMRRAHQKLILDVKGACLEAFTNVALQTNKNHIAFERNLVILSFG